MQVTKLNICKFYYNMNALHRVENALTKVGLSDIILKPQQVQCFEYLLQGYDVIAVLPTGFGKSLLF